MSTTTQIFFTGRVVITGIHIHLAPQAAATPSRAKSLTEPLSLLGVPETQSAETTGTSASTGGDAAPVSTGAAPVNVAPAQVPVAAGDRIVLSCVEPLLTHTCVVPANAQAPQTRQTPAAATAGPSTVQAAPAAASTIRSGFKSVGEERMDERW
ncbi:hypothetical protein B0H11DRAFT_1940608 [Mycena galericulata]|nr:hypothetical protein B0H11DRAFT_1940608 [Mycena galericulata]